MNHNLQQYTYRVEYGESVMSSQGVDLSVKHRHTCCTPVPSHVRHRRPTTNVMKNAGLILSVMQFTLVEKRNLINGKYHLNVDANKVLYMVINRPYRKKKCLFSKEIFREHRPPRTKIFLVSWGFGGNSGKM